MEIAQGCMFLQRLLQMVRCEDGDAKGSKHNPCRPVPEAAS